MTSERWQRIADIFHAAQDREGDERAAFVRQAADNSDVRREVESLLAADAEPMVLDHPIGATAHAVLIDNASVQPGTYIAGYRIDSLLGVGGMGEVYRASDTKLDRDVAIKILPPAFANDPERLARFKREAQMLAQLNHPNIGAIHGFEDSDGIHALVLELVEGPTLADMLDGAWAHGSGLRAQGQSGARPEAQSLKPKALSVSESLAIAGQIANALEAAHELGIIHRDLKPSNIKVRDDGTVKVLDFGLAKMTEVASHQSQVAGLTQSPTITTPAMTVAGMILGTAAYMSPEQAKGKPADKRSDIWAFGVVLYEMLTGERPFKGDDVADTLASVLRAEPDWSRLPSDAPPAALRLLRRALTKPREQRTGDITSVKLDLDDSRAPLQESLAPVPGRSSQRLLWLVAGAVVVALALAAYLWLPWRPVAPPLQPLVRLDADLDVELTTTGFASVVLSPDGRRVAYVSRGRLFTRALDQADAVELTGVSGASSPFFSPDGRWIAYYSGNSLRKVSVDGGAPIPIAQTTAIFVGGFWAEHGFLVAPLGTLTPLSRITEGAVPTPLTTLADGERGHRWPHMLPGDTAVLFTTLQSESIDNANIDLLELGSGARQTIQRGGSFPRFVPASDHNGFITYLSRGALFALPFDSASMRVLGPSVRILDRIAYTAETGSAAFDVARNGTAVLREVSQQPEPTMQWLNASSQLQPVTSTPGRWPAFSPDGQQLAMVADGELRVVDLATGNSRVVATREAVAGNIGGVVWSRDGRFVLFGNGTYGTRYVSADGGSRVTVLIREGSAPSDFSPDGTKLLVRRFTQRGGNSDLVLASITNTDTGPTVSGMEDYVATGSSEYAGTFSPNGKWIAYMSSESSIYEVYVRAVPDTGARYRVSLAGGNFPAWSRTAPEIYFQAADGQVMVSRYSVRSGAFISEPPKAWGGKRLEGLTTNRLFDLSRDGARVVGSFTAAGEGARPNGRVTFLLNFADELRRRIPLP